MYLVEEKEASRKKFAPSSGRLIPASTGNMLNSSGSGTWSDVNYFFFVDRRDTSTSANFRAEIKWESFVT